MQKLDFSCNKIVDAGATALAEALKSNECLQKLDLYGSGIGLALGALMALLR